MKAPGSLQGPGKLVGAMPSPDMAGAGGTPSPFKKGGPVKDKKKRK